MIADAPVGDAVRWAESVLRDIESLFSTEDCEHFAMLVAAARLTLDVTMTRRNTAPLIGCVQHDCAQCRARTIESDAWERLARSYSKTIDEGIAKLSTAEVRIRKLETALRECSALARAAGGDDEPCPGDPPCDAHQIVGIVTRALT